MDAATPIKQVQRPRSAKDAYLEMCSPRSTTPSTATAKTPTPPVPSAQESRGQSPYGRWKGGTSLLSHTSQDDTARVSPPRRHAKSKLGQAVLQPRRPMSASSKNTSKVSSSSSAQPRPTRIEGTLITPTRSHTNRPTAAATARRWQASPTAEDEVLNPSVAAAVLYANSPSLRQVDHRRGYTSRLSALVPHPPTKTLMLDDEKAKDHAATMYGATKPTTEIELSATSSGKSSVCNIIKQGSDEFTSPTFVSTSAKENDDDRCSVSSGENSRRNSSEAQHIVVGLLKPHNVDSSVSTNTALPTAGRSTSGPGDDDFTSVSHNTWQMRSMTSQFTDGGVGPPSLSQTQQHTRTNRSSSTGGSSAFSSNTIPEEWRQASPGAAVVGLGITRHPDGPNVSENRSDDSADHVQHFLAFQHVPPASADAFLSNSQSQSDRYSQVLGCSLFWKTLFPSEELMHSGGSSSNNTCQLVRTRSGVTISPKLALEHYLLAMWSTLRTALETKSQLWLNCAALPTIQACPFAPNMASCETSLFQVYGSVDVCPPGLLDGVLSVFMGVSSILDDVQHLLTVSSYDAFGEEQRREESGERNSPEQTTSTSSDVKTSSSFSSSPATPGPPLPMPPSRTPSPIHMTSSFGAFGKQGQYLAQHVLQEVASVAFSFAFSIAVNYAEATIPLVTSNPARLPYLAVDALLIDSFKENSPTNFSSRIGNELQKERRCHESAAAQSNAIKALWKLMHIEQHAAFERLERAFIEEEDSVLRVENVADVEDRARVMLYLNHYVIATEYEQRRRLSGIQYFEQLIGVCLPSMETMNRAVIVEAEEDNLLELFDMFSSTKVVMEVVHEDVVASSVAEEAPAVGDQVRSEEEPIVDDRHTSTKEEDAQPNSQAADAENRAPLCLDHHEWVDASTTPMLAFILLGAEEVPAIAQEEEPTNNEVSTADETVATESEKQPCDEAPAVETTKGTPPRSETTPPQAQLTAQLTHREWIDASSTPMLAFVLLGGEEQESAMPTTTEADQATITDQHNSSSDTNGHPKEGGQNEEQHAVKEETPPTTTAVPPEDQKKLVEMEVQTESTDQQDQEPPQVATEVAPQRHEVSEVPAATKIQMVDASTQAEQEETKEEKATHAEEDPPDETTQRSTPTGGEQCTPSRELLSPTKARSLHHENEAPPPQPVEEVKPLTLMDDVVTELRELEAAADGGDATSQFLIAALFRTRQLTLQAVVQEEMDIRSGIDDEWMAFWLHHGENGLNQFGVVSEEVMNEADTPSASVAPSCSAAKPEEQVEDNCPNVAVAEDVAPEEEQAPETPQEKKVGAPGPDQQVETETAPDQSNALSSNEEQHHDIDDGCGMTSQPDDLPFLTAAAQSPKGKTPLLKQLLRLGTPPPSATTPSDDPEQLVVDAPSNTGEQQPSPPYCYLSILAAAQRSDQPTLLRQLLEDSVPPMEKVKPSSAIAHHPHLANLLCCSSGSPDTLPMLQYLTAVSPHES